MIKIGFSTHKGNILSAFIRRLTNAKVSHCFFTAEDPILGGDIILQADIGGWEPWSIESFKEKGNTIITTVDPKHPIDDAVKEWGKKMGSIGYDYLGLVTSLVVIVGRWFRRRWHNPVHSSKALFCSEAIVEVLQTANYPGAADLVPWDTTPQDLLDFLTRTQ